MREGFLEGDLSHTIIGAFYEVYNCLRYGFLEHVYTASLERELRGRGLRVAREVYVRVFYKGEEVALQRIDMIVNDTVVIEVKATLELHQGARRQLRNYLRSTRLQVGLLFHFGPDPDFFRVVCRNPLPQPPE